MTNIFTISKEQAIKIGVKFLLVVLAGIVTWLQSYLPGVLEAITNSPIVLTILLAINTSLIDFLRKFISDEEGKLGGIRIN